jgi:hypothetical protein
VLVSEEVEPSSAAHTTRPGDEVRRDTPGGRHPQCRDTRPSTRPSRPGCSPCACCWASAVLLQAGHAPRKLLLLLPRARAAVPLPPTAFSPTHLAHRGDCARAACRSMAPAAPHASGPVQGAAWRVAGARLQLQMGNLMDSSAALTHAPRSPHAAPPQIPAGCAAAGPLPGNAACP